MRAGDNRIYQQEIKESVVMVVFTFEMFYNPLYYFF